jgi:predicted metal-dependent phosphoesterase TrpH
MRLGKYVTKFEHLWRNLERRPFMVRARADLHTHSSFSDGTDTPAELVRKADEIQLGGLALTDHDTVNGLKEFMNTESTYDMIRVPGVELSSEHQGREVHVLGYFIQLESDSLLRKLEDLREIRRVRFPKMVSKLRDLGIEIEQSEIDEFLQDIEAPGRPHLALFLKEKGVVKTVGEAFDRYLAEDKPAYVKKERLSTPKAIEFLREEGAVPVIAHPLSSGFPNLSDFLIEMKKFGLMGVESEYNYTPMKIAAGKGDVSGTIQGLDLISTGGSDYHGGQWMSSLGQVTVPLSVIDDLRKKAKIPRA